jgi:hypothetical protein
MRDFLIGEQMKKLLATCAVAFFLPMCAWSQINQGGGSGAVQNPNQGGAGGATIPATSNLLKGSGSPNAASAATPGTDYVSPSTTVNGHPLSSNVAVSASDLTTGTLPHARLPVLLSADIPNNSANTGGTAAGLSGTPALPNGTTATTQTLGDNSNKAATDAFVQAAMAAILGPGATVIDYSGGTAVTLTAGTNVTSATCTSSVCTTARGSLSIVGGTATTGTIATIGFNDTPTSTIVCDVHQNFNGSATNYFIGHADPTTTSVTVTSGASVAGATVKVDYSCSE